MRLLTLKVQLTQTLANGTKRVHDKKWKIAIVSENKYKTLKVTKNSFKIFFALPIKK